MIPSKPHIGELDVIVVGGGIAGLTCAVGLADAGARVLVLERSEQLGGRARSFNDDATGWSLPIGPHVFLENYRNVLSFFDAIGSEHRIVWEKRPHMTVTNGTHAFEASLDMLPPPLHFWPALVKRPRSGALEISCNLLALMFALQVEEADALCLDAFSASEVLGWLGVPQPSLITLWSFMARSILNVPLDACSAGSLFRFCAFLVSRKAPRFGFADSGLGDVFVPAARRHIETRGGRVRTGAGVTEIAVREGRVAGVRLTDGSELRAPFVVAATPADALFALLPEPLVREHASLTALTRFQPSPYVSVFLWFDRKLTQRRFWARSYAPGDFGCDFYDLSNIYPDAADKPSLIAANIIYSERVHGLEDDAIAGRIRAEIQEFLPEAGRARLLHQRVQRIPMAVHCPYVGIERLRPPAESPLAGLLLAGDWTRTGLPSSMESAARSGWLAAEGVLRELGRARSLAQLPPPVAPVPRLYRGAVGLLPVRPVRALLESRRMIDRFRERTRAGQRSLARRG